jgi:5-hydroxyisourate hydrolase
MARLSTHVLDTARGTPADGLVIDLHQLTEEGPRHLATTATNADGRTLLLPAADPGVYELTFHAGDYLRRTNAELPDPAFLDEIVIRFGVADGAANYHVPLLLSPFGYSTYRGS